MNSIITELSSSYIKLTAYSRKAHLELKHNIARLFDALSFSKQVQAISLMNSEGLVNDTKSNLSNLRPNENKHNDTQALKNDNNVIEAIKQIEEMNQHLYACTADALDAGKDINIGTICVCSKCGCVLPTDSPKECNVCHSPSGYFRLF